MISKVVVAYLRDGYSCLRYMRIRMLYPIALSPYPACVFLCQKSRPQAALSLQARRPTRDAGMPPLVLWLCDTIPCGVKRLAHVTLATPQVQSP